MMPKKINYLNLKLVKKKKKKIKNSKVFLESKRIDSFKYQCA